MHKCFKLIKSVLFGVQNSLFKTSMPYYLKLYTRPIGVYTNASNAVGAKSKFNG